MIIPMKKATLAISQDEAPAVIKALQRIGEFMVISDSGGSAVKLRTEGAPLSAEAEAALKAFAGFRKKSFLSSPYECTYEEFDKSSDADRQSVIEAISLSETLESQNAQLKRLDEEEKILLPFSGLPLTAEELSGTSNTKFLCGRLPRQKGEEDPLGALAAAYAFAPEVYRDEKNGCYLYAACFTEELPAVRAALAELGFEEMTPPYKSGTADENLRMIADRRAALLFQREQTTERLCGEAKNAAAIELFYDREKAKLGRSEIHGRQTAETVVIEGWVRSDRLEAVEDAIRRETDGYYLSFTDPGEDEIPPTVTKNNRFITPFETITDGFSLPSGNDVDPNPIMAPWYFILFGIMMGDVCYGVLLLLGGLLFKRLKKPRGEMLKLVNCLTLGGISTIVWGVIFGSYFGAAWFPPLWFNPADTNDSTAVLKMLIFSLIVGVLHLFSGVIAKAYMNFKAGKWADALLDQVTTIVMIIGAGLIFLEATRTVGIILAAASAALIVLTGGRHSESPVMKIFGGLVALYNLATGYLSDILSYSRLLALCLCTGVIAYVMNLLGGMVAGIGAAGIIAAIPIYVFGHALNLVLAILSAYVHDSRLQYIELYSKFYEGSGKPFTPLRLETDYTVVVPDRAQKNK